MNRAEWPQAVHNLYRRRWRIWIVAVLAHAIGMFHRAAMAPMADRIMADFDISAVAFGSLGAVYFYIYAAMQLPSGTLADTLGPRKMIIAGLLLSSVGSLVMGVAPSFRIVYVGRLAVSFGVSVVWLSVIKVLMGWFRTRELATIIGLSISIACLGQLAGTTPLALLVTGVGWRISFVITSLVSFALAVANWAIIKDSPAQAGLPSTAEHEWQAALRVVTPRGRSKSDLARRFKIVFGNRRFLPLLLLNFGTYGAYATLFHNWAVLYFMQTYGIHRDFAANFVLVATIGLMAGAPVVGFISDQISRQRRLPCLVFAGSTMASFLLLTFWNGGKPPLQTLYPLCFFVGFGTSATFIPLACVKDMVQPSVRGIASGLVNMVLFAGAAVGQPLFGYILELGWTGEMMEDTRVYPLDAFQQGLLLCCVLAILGFLGALFIKETPNRESQRA